MQSQHQAILLVGNDPEILLLRSAVLASAGICSLRVGSADQAVELLRKIPCALAVICYTLDRENQQELLDFVLNTRSRTKILCMIPGDDCSGTGFLRRVTDALQERDPIPNYYGVPELAAPSR